VREINLKRNMLVMSYLMIEIKEVEDYTKNGYSLMLLKSSEKKRLF